jgi:hypothetical protein
VGLAWRAGSRGDLTTDVRVRQGEQATDDVERRREVGRRRDGVCRAAEVMRRKRALEGAIVLAVNLGPGVRALSGILGGRWTD